MTGDSYPLQCVSLSLSRYFSWMSKGHREGKEKEEINIGKTATSLCLSLARARFPARPTRGYMD